FLVSYHGSMGSKGSVLSHTYFPAAFAEISINGVVAGEAGINSLVANAYGVPIVLVTGDATTAEETERFCPGIKTAVVKKSITRFSAEALHPEAARDLIRQQARLAVEELPTARQAAVELPATLRILFRSSDYCELAGRIAGVERTGDLSANIIGGDPLLIYQTFITVVLLCRGLVE
ncbi:MAG: D-amino peptidase, partial [Streptomycetaceae bacterium]|nr:D-amino peptidase [Streptomycetaceae bacterium]